MKKLRKNLLTAATALSMLIGGTACGATICLETEQFADRGGWVVDSQFIDQIGSSFLLAHGIMLPILALSLSAAGCGAGEGAQETAQETQEEAPPAGENAAEEGAEVVDQSSESVSRYAGVYKARRDMRKALNLTLPGGTDLVRTKVKLTYVLTLREDGSFDLETEDGDEAFLAAKREATIEIVRSIQAGKLKEAGYSEEQFDEVAGISGFADFEDMVISTAEKQMEESRSATSYTLSGTFRTQDRLILMTGKNAAGEEENMTLRVRRDGNLNLPLGEQHLMFRKQEEE